MAAEDEEHAAFDDEDDDLEDTEGDDTDMDYDDEDEDDAGVQGPAAPPHLPPSVVAAVTADLNSASASFHTPVPTPNPNPPSDPPPAPQNGAIQVIPINSAAVSAAGSGGETAGAAQTPDVKRPRIEERRPAPSASIEESRRLFQRLWTDDDEIKILKGFWEFTASRGTTFASHQYDTGPFYEQIKNELQLDFNKNQLIEKLRRLKKKYRNTANRMVNHGKDFTFKSPHEKATYDIARKIWSASTQKSRDSDDDDLNPYANNTSDAGMSSDRKTTSRSRRRGRKRALESIPAAPVVPALLPPPPPPPLPAVTVGPSESVVKVEVQTLPATTPALMATPIQKPANSTTVPAPPPPPPPAIPSVIEETVKSCLSPIFKELLSSTVSAPLGLGTNLPPLLNFGVGGSLGNVSSDEKWKQQQILELEVYLKRVELVRDQIKSTLEELKGPQPQPAPAPAGN